MKKVKNIIEGKINRLRKTEIDQKRLNDCLSCPHNVPAPISLLRVKDDIEGISERICDLCMCPLPDKLRAKDETCPDGRW